MVERRRDLVLVLGKRKDDATGKQNSKGSGVWMKKRIDESLTKSR